MQLPKLFQDGSTKIALFFLIAAIVLLISYQLYFAFFVNPIAPMLEPDNYIYMTFVSLVIHSHTLNVSNPYLVYPHVGFFEQPGLYLVPVMVHYVLPFLPLAWDFRIPYAIAILTIYLVPLLILKRVLRNSPLSKAYRWVAYALVLFQFLLLQQSEIIEWRGSLFVVALQLIMFYVITAAFMDWKVWSKVKRVLAIVSIPVLLAMSWFMWTGWTMNLIPIFLVVLYLLYKRFSRRSLYRIAAGAIVVFAIVLGLFSVPIIHGIVFSLNDFNLHPATGKGMWCLNNPLDLGEVSCLTPSNGLYAVCIDLSFTALALWIFLGDNVFAQAKGKYEYYIIGVAAMAIIQLPLALIYLRAIQLIAPYLAIGFSLGIVSFFIKASKVGTSKVVMAVVISGILISSAFSFMIFWSTTSVLYQLDNPVGLIAASQYLASNANNSSTVLAYYGWSDYLEYNAHVKVYVDTIQELGLIHVGKSDAFYAGTPPSTCSYLSNLTAQPDYIVASNSLTDLTLFVNASNSSIVKEPLGVEQCGYSLAWTSNDFYVFKR